MILIGDSGATKTDWRLLDGKKIEQFVQPGFNATTHDPKVFIQGIMDRFGNLSKEINQVHLYLAGINDDLTNPLKTSLQELFPKSDIQIESDMLGAARALFGKEQGIVGILGTGANACKYDGQQITHKIPPLGYILGDEGSGNYLGKKFLSMYLRNRFSLSLNSQIQIHFEGLEEASVLKEVYTQPASTYLASFVRFMIDHQNHPELYPLIHQSFHDYFEAFQLPEVDTQLKYRFTGSVAHYLGNILRKVATERGITLDLIAQSPIAGLALYHQENG